jgi:PTS system glucitol/sorbitol-specific IIC component
MLTLSHLAESFIGIFNEGGKTFVAFATGILPTLIVLLTAVYALIEIVGEQRVHRLARFAGRYALTRYTLLPVLAMFFLTNPMAYTFGVFIEEKHKPAFYDPITGLFPHANSSELFVWLGVAHGLTRLHLPLGPLAVRYFIAGLVVILLKGIVTERITLFFARRQGVTL